MRKKGKYFICLFVVFLVLLSVVFAQDWSGSSGYDYDATPGEEGGTGSGSGAGVPGSEGDTEIDLTEFCQETGVCTTVSLDVGIYCYLEGRGSPDVRRVVNWPATWIGFLSEENVYESVDGYYLEDLVDDDYEIGEAFLDPDQENEYAWDTEYWSYVPWITNSETDDTRLYRYEGKGVSGDESFPQYAGCRAYGAYYTAVGVTTPEMIGIDQSGQTYYFDDVDEEEIGTDAAEAIWWGTPSTWSGTWNNIDASIDVMWDEDPFDCAKIGGAWLEATEFDDNDGHQYYCCGDDYLWVNNRPLTEEESSASVDDVLDAYEEVEEIDDDEEQASAKRSLGAAYCLYGVKDEGDESAVQVIPSGDYYTCDPTEFAAYDEALELGEKDWEECYGDEENLLATCPFRLTAKYDEDIDTDLGKWSALETDDTPYNPYVCRIQDVEKGIPSFNWSDVNEVGDEIGDDGYPLDIEGNEITDLSQPEYRATTICEKYLGGKWTGGYCCGNKYDYDSSEYIDESYSETTPIYYNDGATVLHQYACLQATIYDDGTTARYAKDDGTTVELLNNEGTWYGCNIEDTTGTGTDYYTESSLITETTNSASCAVVGSYLCNYNYTDDDEDGTPESEEWEWYSLTNANDGGEYVEDVLGYDSGDTFTSNLEATPWAADEGLQPYGCCAANRCWDGTACVDEYSEYTYTDTTTTEEVVAICYQGSWSGPKETKYDWYANTDAAAVDYCVNSYACVCSTSDDDDTYCTNNEEYVVSGCTMVQDFYSNDHFCEAVDTDGDGIDEDDTSRWTSRTKFLAFQLLDMAETEGTKYTLFCDKYSNAVNNYVDLEPIEEEINSVCILKQEDTVTVGITLNSQNMTHPMSADLEETLFDSNGFIDAALEEDVDNCEDALAEDQSIYRFGKFFSCDGSDNVWYNSKLNALIYSRDGLSTEPSADEEDPYIDSWQTILDTAKETLITYIEDNDPENPAEQELTEYFIDIDEEEYMGVENIQDYNRFYYSAENSVTIIGVEDIKYNGNDDNRYYMAVLYGGPTLDCDQVYAPYGEDDIIHCDSTNGIVLERSTEGSAYWRSLTAGFRVEE